MITQETIKTNESFTKVIAQIPNRAEKRKCLPLQHNHCKVLYINYGHSCLINHSYIPYFICHWEVFICFSVVQKYMLHKTKATIVQYLHLTIFYSYISKGNILFDFDRETGIVLDWLDGKNSCDWNKTNIHFRSLCEKNQSSIALVCVCVELSEFKIRHCVTMNFENNSRNKFCMALSIFQKIS